MIATYQYETQYEIQDEIETRLAVYSPVAGLASERYTLRRCTSRLLADIVADKLPLVFRPWSNPLTRRFTRLILRPLRRISALSAASALRCWVIGLHLFQAGRAFIYVISVNR